MTEDKILLTARYVEGDLDETARADFENRVQDDADLQQHLKDYNHIHQSLRMQLSNANDDVLFKAGLKNLNQQYFREEPKVLAFKPILTWLSGIAALLVIGLFIWAPWQSLYQDYADNGQMLVTERGAVQATDLDRAASLYNDGNYAAAQPILAKLNAKEPSNVLVAYYFSLTLIETNELAKARTLLEPIYNGESIFKYDAAYAVAMSYLKADDKKACKTWLDKIPQGTSRYAQASKLKQKL